MDTPFLSIGIMSYNRVDATLRLLKSIDYTGDDLEVVICEDHSPEQLKIRAMVEEFRKSSPLHIKYHENEKNRGYDGNFRSVIEQSSGEYITYMGNDDVFLPGALGKVIAFLKAHREIGYMLRAYKRILPSGTEEVFRYYSENHVWQPGGEAVKTLYRKSVFISGFTIRREPMLEYMTDRFDGTLLMQLYYLCEICMRLPSIYFNEPFTCAFPKVGGTIFGNSEAEKKLYTPGNYLIENCLNFLGKFYEITEYIDEKYHIGLTDSFRKDMSKYFYPNLALQRSKGLKEFLRFVHEVRKLHYDCTIYFWIYVVALTLFKRNFCDQLIAFIKKYLGHTPTL